MATRVIVGIAALACVTLCGMIATFANYEMMDKVNEKLPKDEQFDPLGWHLVKHLRLRREYKRLYPGGRLLLKVRVLTALMFAWLLVFVWGFRFFAR
jgi:hypothetical protein